MDAILIKRIWPVASLTAVVAVSISNLVHVARKVLPPPTRHAPHVMLDHVTRTERRFSALRDHARSRGLTGTIGYMEDTPIDALARDADVDYFIAQFSVLPLVLDSTLSHSPWTIGNFRSSSPPAIPTGWHVAQDFGQGVLLLEKSAR